MIPYIKSGDVWMQKRVSLTFLLCTLIWIHVEKPPHGIGNAASVKTAHLVRCLKPPVKICVLLHLSHVPERGILGNLSDASRPSWRHRETTTRSLCAYGGIFKEVSNKKKLMDADYQQNIFVKWIFQNMEPLVFCRRTHCITAASVSVIFSDN